MSTKGRKSSTSKRQRMECTNCAGKNFAKDEGRSGDVIEGQQSLKYIPAQYTVVAFPRTTRSRNTGSASERRRMGSTSYGERPVRRMRAKGRRKVCVDETKNEIHKLRSSEFQLDPFRRRVLPTS